MQPKQAPDKNIHRRATPPMSGYIFSKSTLQLLKKNTMTVFPQKSVHSRVFLDGRIIYHTSNKLNAI